jgi:3-hydroxyisobutyrate dehydrogenase-like beta-hydroxyacid dehydrogenase
MSDVSVIGLGEMGSALARALLQDGHEVTVWNRTIAKAEPLAKEGATPVPDPAAAVVASPIVMACVTDYDATRAILSSADVRDQLAGRTVVQLSAGTPRESLDLESWVRDHGADYLDGNIQVYPDAIGTPEAVITFAGTEAAFQRCRPILQSLGGAISHVGENAAMASALAYANGMVTMGALLGAIQGALICESVGVPVDEFTSKLVDDLPSIVGAMVQDLGERIQSNHFDHPQASLQTWALGAQQSIQLARDSHVDAAFPLFLKEHLQKGIEAGLGSEDLSALVKVLRKS